MTNRFPALRAELLKNRHSTITKVTIAAFGLAPLMGGVFMLILSDPEATAQAGALSAKARLMSFSVDWTSYFGLLTQAMGVGGVLIFGFVASWLFGREYSEGTAKDLLSLPTSRARIIHAKFVVYALWCLTLMVSNLLIGLLIGLIVQLPGSPFPALGAMLPHHLITTVLTISLGTPVALLALWGKGYLAPLGFVSFMAVIAQIIAAAGYGHYFPWTIAGLFSGISQEAVLQLNGVSYMILAATSLVGYFCTVLYWNRADQAK
ncbi:ABC transporter permease [Salmonirosea aquatica]|uniref:ABC transporter permease subunit n=1 Tax=Salmonirosea aquatica TaxID=2654236 RepID=A0A7C9BFS9_9BACT|nr:ABC transporter permease subunit [Cytophagaceae bacterium SJW1-29]